MLKRSLKVKVCGMREQLNIEGLCQLPVDFIGLIFYEKSKRYIFGAQFNQEYLKGSFLRKKLTNDKIEKVGVFVNEDIAKVIALAKEYQLDYVQLHGSENIFYCKKIKQAGIKIIKAFSIDKQFVFTNLEAYHFYCDYFLFDTKGKLPGGNGYAFDWNVLQKYQGGTPFFLSGGIRLGMEDKVNSFHHPALYALDLNSGFEDKPGFKNLDKLSSFINQVG